MSYGREIKERGESGRCKERGKIRKKTSGTSRVGRRGYRPYRFLENIWINFRSTWVWLN